MPEDPVRSPAVSDISPTITRRRSVIERKACPSASRSERGSTSWVRSPPAIASAIRAFSLSESTMAPNAPAMRPTSSWPRAWTATSRSPSAIRSAARATSATGRLKRDAISSTTMPTASKASAPIRISVVRRLLTPASTSAFGATATKLQPPVFTGV